MLTSARTGKKRLATLLGSVTMMVVLAVAVIGPPMAVAQATRTWVSGVGDDVNPCSRTAPCKTFAGAISKTAAGGEINCLDPGGFGAVTIIKAMTIDCEYTEGGMLAGGNGVVVNAPADAVVNLRGLDIFGVNPPTNGIRFIAGAALHVDNVRIKRFNSAGSWGISFQPAGVSELFVSNSLITDNGDGLAGLSGGILIKPTGAAGTARVTLVNVDIVNNTQGFRADTTGGTAADMIKVNITDSSASDNVFAGFAAVSTAATGNRAVDLMIEGSSASYNGGAGFTANGLNTLIRMGRCVSTGNATGTLPFGGGIVESYQTNQIHGNASDGSRTNINQN